MDTNLHLPSCRVEEFSFSRSSRSGRFSLRNGCEGRTPLAWESRDRSHQTPTEAFDVFHSRMHPKEKAADCSAADFIGYFVVSQ
jgi:hypothetical protein